MGTWNLRVIEDNTKPDDKIYFVAEIFYDDDGEMYAYTCDKGVNLLGETYEDLKKYYEMCKEAFQHPVINIKEFD